jgi:hypothetical protein
MPSFHAQIAFFYSTYNQFGPMAFLGAPSVFFHIIAAATTYGRVHLGKHTYEQVGVGMLIGVAQALMTVGAMQFAMQFAQRMLLI